MTWTTVAQPAVGDKITAAGFGDQVHDSVTEIQDWISDVDSTAPSLGFGPQWRAALLREQATPGRSAADLISQGPTAVVAGPTTIVTAPSSGRRIVKTLLLGGSASGATCELIVNSVSIAKLTFTAVGVIGLDLALPLQSGQALTATVTGGTVTATASYVDRSDTTVDRLALAAFSGSTTLISSGTARTLTQIWIGNPSASAATCQVTVGGTDIVGGAVSISPGGVLSIDSPTPITSSQALAVVASGATLGAFVTGY